MVVWIVVVDWRHSLVGVLLEVPLIVLVVVRILVLLLLIIVIFLPLHRVLLSG